MGTVSVIIIGAVCTVIGYILGSSAARGLLDGIEWSFYKWDASVFGFRPITLDRSVFPSDRVIMGVSLDTTHLPSSGMKLSEFLNLSQIEDGEVP